MSSPMKMSLLALISTVAAAPHYGNHHQFHRRSGGYGGVGTGTAPGHAYPTGRWGGANSTGLYPTGTGYDDGKTTTLDQTITSTQTIVSTIYATLPASEGLPNGSEDFSTGAPGCGPETVYVTATNQVTVTVGLPSSIAEAVSSSSVVEVPSSVVVPVSSAPVYDAPSSVAVPVSSAPASEAPSSVAAPVSSAPIYEAPAPSSEAAPVSSAEESKTPVYEEVKPSSTPAPISVSLENKPVVHSSTPAPSATPSTTPSGGSYSGGKRGLAYNEASLCHGFPNAAFAYNWAQTEGNNLPEGTQYVPMMHKPSDSTPEAWKANVRKAVAAGTKVVMSFNEPDHDRQANMRPGEACKQWKNYMDLKGEFPDLTILGPSVTNGFVEGEKPMGLPWLEAFYAECPNVGDAVNIHFYDIPDGAVERFKLQVEKAYTMFNKKVWVTEFGLNPGSATPQQAAAFVKEVTAWMDNNDHVQGYAYFMVGTGENMLNSGTGLSPIGEVYAS